MMSAQAPPDTQSRYGNAKAKTFKTVHETSPEEVPGVVAGLRRAFRKEKTMPYSWRVQQLKQLRKMILECKEELGDAMLKDLHKSHFEGFVTELNLCVSEIDTALDQLGKWMQPKKTKNSALNIPSWSTTQHDPLGVVLIMGAWNYPMQLALAPMVGALAGGNCILLKPASYATHSSNTLASLIPRYLDPECVRVLEGNRTMTTAILKERFDKIMFTGSGFVGRIVARAAAEHLTPVVLELGGKSPCIIDRSADLEHACQRLVWGSFLNGGQTCVRPDFVMVHADLADAFFAEVKRTIRKYYGEDPQGSEWFGRCINDTAFRRLTKIMEENKKYMVHGGRHDKGDRFIEPSVFDFGSDMEAFSGSSLMSDELFGPLMPCFRYHDLEEVISFVKDLPTGKPLALYAFTKDQHVAEMLKARTTSGGLNINDCLMHLANHELPFGGVGSSGMGAYHGKYSFDCFTHEKAVLEKSQRLDQSFAFKPLLQARFPPYTQTKQALVKVFTKHIIEKIVNFPVPFLRQSIKLLLVLFVLYKLGFRVQRV